MTEATYFSGVQQVKAYRVLQSNVSREVKKFGLNPTQWFILGQISEEAKVRASDIASLLRVEAPLITSLTDDLVDKGLIDKVPDLIDKRVKNLQLTASGAKLVPQIESKLRESLTILLDGLSDQELKTYDKVLKTIVKNGENEE